MFKRILTAKVSIDVGEKTVRVVKTNISGKIIKSAVAELPVGMPAGMQDAPDAQYSAALTQAIKKASKEARAAKGSNTVMVVGGSHVIVRAFTWPEMLPDALASNAETEIAPYLPDELNTFSVHYTIMRRSTIKMSDKGTPVIQLEVLVAAISKNIVTAYMQGARKAGFSPLRLDVRENVRGKLFHNSSIWPDVSESKRKFSPEKSFAVLDVADSLINMTVFINGTYYANRYFSLRSGSFVSEDSSLPPIADASLENSLINDAAETQTTASAVVDSDQLATEVASIIDYIHYRERGSQVDCMMIFGNVENVPNLLESLSDNLDIPLIRPDEMLAENILSAKLKAKGDKISDYLDGYGALLAPPKKLSLDLNLKIKRKKRNILKRIIVPAACILLVWSALLAVGIYFPNLNLKNLQNREAQLDAELSTYTVSETDIALLMQEINVLIKTTEEAASFLYRYAQASRVLDAVVDAMPRASNVSKISVSNGAVSLVCTTDSHEKTSEIILNLRENKLFGNVRLNNVSTNATNDVITIDITFGFNSGLEVGE